VAVKVRLDPNTVEQTSKEGRKENVAAVAERIVRPATVLDKREGLAGPLA
jgi:hypothetical protein